MNRAFHDGLVVIDGLQYSNWDRALFEELRAGGLTAVHVTLVYWENARETLGLIARWHRWFEAHGDLVLHGRSAADILEAKRSGRIAIIFGFQNCSPIEDDLGLVRVFHELGVRVMQLTYNNQSLLGGGCYEPTDSGLTRFGREVVREMNRVGMLIDLSHSGERTTLDAIEASGRPIIISHADPHSFHPVPRNKSEHVLRALSESGGMLGFSLYPLHIGGADCSLERFCAMIARTVELMGIDHVGFGTDTVRNWPDSVLDWMRRGRSARNDTGPKPVWPQWPAWFRTPADFPNLTAGLLATGFSEQETAKIMGGNWLRFFAQGFEPLEAAAESASRRSA